MSVEELGIKELLPAYLDPNLKSQDLLTGVNFASGGTGYDPLTPKIAVHTHTHTYIYQSSFLINYDIMNIST